MVTMPTSRDWLIPTGKRSGCQHSTIALSLSIISVDQFKAVFPLGGHILPFGSTPSLSNETARIVPRYAAATDMCM